MKQKKLRITQEDFILANRKAARMEEIERHGRQVQSRRMVHKSKKTYDRNRLKRAVIKSDDGSLSLYETVKNRHGVQLESKWYKKGQIMTKIRKERENYFKQIK